VLAGNHTQAVEMYKSNRTLVRVLFSSQIGFFGRLCVAKQDFATAEALFDEITSLKLSDYGLTVSLINNAPASSSKRNLERVLAFMANNARTPMSEQIGKGLFIRLLEYS
jgi:hypothetical protein